MYVYVIFYLQTTRPTARRQNGVYLIARNGRTRDTNGRLTAPTSSRSTGTAPFDAHTHTQTHTHNTHTPRHQHRADAHAHAHILRSTVSIVAAPSACPRELTFENPLPLVVSARRLHAHVTSVTSPQTGSAFVGRGKFRSGGALYAHRCAHGGFFAL